MPTESPNLTPRRLEVRWLESSWLPSAVRVTVHAGGEGKRPVERGGLTGLGSMLRGRRWQWPGAAGFTVLEMLVVVTIIGILAGLAMPHLTGITSGNTMTLATQQLLNDLGLARQLAMSHRTTVYVVFASPSLASYQAPNNELTTYSTVMSHQYGAYALASLSSVGDQPGAHYPQYLTPWKGLPSGVFIAASKFIGGGPATLTTSNTLSGTANAFPNTVFPNSVSLPFPAADAILNGYPATATLPCVAFLPSGQLTSLNSYGDEYIPLARGRVLNVPGAAAIATEQPASNSVINPTIIHIDALTGRAKIERNQF